MLAGTACCDALLEATGSRFLRAHDCSARASFCSVVGVRARYVIYGMVAGSPEKEGVDQSIWHRDLASVMVVDCRSDN